MPTNNPTGKTDKQPKLILHNSISLDGSLIGFDVNMALHYQIARKLEPDAHLIGSNTIEEGILLFGNDKLGETHDDMEKLERSMEKPL